MSIYANNKGNNERVWIDDGSNRYTIEYHDGKITIIADGLIVFTGKLSDMTRKLQEVY